MLQRLLNLAGAEILALRGAADVTLNLDLLALQFDIELSG